MRKAKPYKTYGRIASLRQSAASIKFDDIVREGEKSKKGSPFGSDSSPGSSKDEETLPGERPRRRCALGTRVIMSEHGKHNSTGEPSLVSSSESSSNVLHDSDSILISSPAYSKRQPTTCITRPREKKEPKRKIAKKSKKIKTGKQFVADKENSLHQDDLHFTDIEQDSFVIESEIAPQSSTPDFHQKKQRSPSNLLGPNMELMNVSQIKSPNESLKNSPPPPHGHLLDHPLLSSVNVTVRRSSRAAKPKRPNMRDDLMKRNLCVHLKCYSEGDHDISYKKESEQLTPTKEMKQEMATKSELSMDLFADDATNDSLLASRNCGSVFSIMEEEHAEERGTLPLDHSEELYSNEETEEDDCEEEEEDYEEEEVEDCEEEEEDCEEEEEDCEEEEVEDCEEEYEEEGDGCEGGEDHNERGDDGLERGNQSSLYSILISTIHEESEDDDCDSPEISVPCQSSHEQSFYDKLACSSFCEEVQVTAEEKVLSLCDQTELISFSTCIPHRMMSECVKIGEGVYGEVYRSVVRGNKVAIKIVPIEGNFEVNDCQQKKFEEILPEVVIAKELSDLALGTSNSSNCFCQVNRISCVQGTFPKHLLEEWDKYTEKRPSENDRPDMFPEDQLFMVFEFADGGAALEKFKFSNHTQAFSVLRQVVFALAVAECSLEFEHRDLHIANILVKPCQEDTVSFVLEDDNMSFASEGVIATIIDFTISRLKKDGCAVFCDVSTDDGLFEGSGDIQFDVYRDMKQENNNDWSTFCPHSNILWVKYLCEKLNTVIKYEDKGRSYRETQRRLRNLSTVIKDYSSCHQLAKDLSLWVL